MDQTALSTTFKLLSSGLYGVNVKGLLGIHVSPLVSFSYYYKFV